jgi:hypothetical protein
MTYNKILLNSIHKPLKKSQGGGNFNGRPTVKQIMQMPDKRYAPTPAVMDTKAGLAAAGMMSGPLSFIPGTAAAVYDLGTAARYAIDGQWDNAKEDLISAGLNAIPTGGVYAALAGMGKLQKAARARAAIRSAKAAMNVKDIAGSSTIRNNITGLVQEFDKAGKEISSMRPRSAAEVKAYNQNLKSQYRTGATPEGPAELMPFRSPDFAGGGMIIDPMGQWAHPGENTRIPGSDITMQGVPYPVLGVGSNGQEQMMYPGQEYNFGGASYVDEYPIMQGGGWSGGGLSRSNLAMMSALNKDIKDQKARDAQVTISQYTPKPGDQQRMNANKDAYRKEQGKFLNRLADNQHMQAAGKNLPGAAEFALDVMTAGEAGVALKAAKPLLKAAGKYLTQKTPLRNASKFNPYALTDNMLFNKEGVVNRQMFGDEAFENFKQYGPTTRPNVSQYDQMMEFIKAPKSDVISGSGEAFQVAKTMEDGAFKYPYFQEGNLWYTGQQRNNLANQLGTERIITTPKSDIWFAPAGEGTVMHGDDLSQGLINSYSKGRRVLIPGSEYAKPSKYSVFEPHWWKGYKQVQEEGGQISMMAYGGYTTGIFAGGGEMIRRADGSYSRRGLWDNIRANKGSGKKPTKEMLEQEKKINMKKYARGGTNNPGFEALPEYVQARILSSMGYGGMTYPFMQEGGEEGEEAYIPQSIEELMAPVRRGVGNFGIGFSNDKFATNYNYTGANNFKEGTHALNVSLPAFMKTGNLDLSGTYSPGKSYGANVMGTAPADYIKKGAMMNFSGGFEKDINPMMKNVTPLYNVGAGFNIPTKAGNFKINASYRKERGGQTNYPYMDEGGEPNGGMALGQMAAVVDKMSKLRKFISEDQNLDPWIASKLAVMDHSADAISDYMMYNPEAQGEEEMEGMPEMRKGGSTFSGNAWYKMGGEPCYECGGMYADGGMYDCDDQEKDPVTGKCAADVARGRQANAANKAATKDMNAWAKQVAAMDKKLAKEYAAQDAGQITFDYDWMQTPLDKPEKKAAIAASKQFFQQNPNVFVADDTSGYSPEQKYIIASKLKQKASTPMGSKAFQQKFNQDARFMDLGRLQSDIVPMMGGWNATRNYLFGNKEQGGIHINPANKGKFTASAKRAGMGVQEFASQVLANKEDYSSTQVKRANFARNAAGWNKANGGLTTGSEMEVTPEEAEMLRQQGYQFEIL